MAKTAFNQFLRTVKDRTYPNRRRKMRAYAPLLRDAVRKTRANDVSVRKQDEAAFDNAVFTRDWFGNRAAWSHFLADGCDSVREYLEIGSFEGRSCLYAAKLFPKAHIIAGDEYTDLDNENSKAIFKNLEGRFLRNIAPIHERVTVLKGTSLQRLSELSDRTESFDAIYIDGSHFYRHALLDTLISWPLLKVGGIMIWDDYIWDWPEYGGMKTNLAVDQFLSAYKGDYEILFVTNQVAIRKARSETRYFGE
jgi:predicted O-methyltransferase YrrM